MYYLIFWTELMINIKNGVFSFSSKTIGFDFFPHYFSLLCFRVVLMSLNGPDTYAESE